MCANSFVYDTIDTGNESCLLKVTEKWCILFRKEYKFLYLILYLERVTYWEWGTAQKLILVCPWSILQF